MTKTIDLGNLIIPIIKPVKGVDYFTSQEQQEMENNVFDRLNPRVEEAETIRQANEAIRVEAETQRSLQEQSRQSEESTRQNNETARVEAEELRQQNEAERVEAEQSRNETFTNQMGAVDTAIDGIHTSQEAYDQNATAKTTAFNQNATAKTTEFNSNANEKINAYNQNASQKIAEYDTHVHDYETELANKVDKVQGKGLSTNDYDNTEKEKVATNATNIATLRSESGHTIELSLDNTTYILTATLKNKSGTILNTSTVDFPVESMIVNMTYDSQTKELVITLQGGTVRRVPLSDIVSGLVSQDDFDELEVEANGLKEDVEQNATNIQENYKVINKLEKKLADQQKVINQLPQVEGQGTEVTLENTIKAPFTQFDMEGKSEQETTKGKNLLPNLTFAETTINGVKIVNNGDGTVTLNGTASANINFDNNNNVSLLGNNTYKTSLWLLGGTLTGKFVFYIFDNNFLNVLGVNIASPSTNAVSSSTLNETVTYRKFRISIPSGTAFNNLVVGMQIGNNFTSYEKYTHGASPNPNYEQPIYSAGDNENLFDIETSTAYQLCTKSDDVFTTSAMTRFAVPKIKLGVPLTVINGTDYYISYDVKTNSGDVKKLNYYGRLSEDAGLNITTNFGELIGTFTMSNSYQRVLWKTTATSDFTANYLFLQATSEITNAQTISIKNIKISEVNTKTYSPYGMGSINEKIQNKNIFDGEMELGTFSNDDGRPVNINTQIRTKNFTRVKSNSVCSLSNSNNYTTFIYMYDKNKKLIKYINSASVTTTEDTKFIKFRTITNQTDLTTKFQLEYGNATDIVSHEEQNISIPTQQPMMDDDYFDRDNNEEVHTWQKIVLDGSSDESWEILDSRTFRIRVETSYQAKWIVIGPNSPSQIKSSIGFINYQVLDNQTGFGLAAINGQIRLNLENIDASKGGTVEQLRAYLSENPITVYVKLKESAYEKLPFTQLQIDAFNEVDEAYSYKGGTYISSEDEVKPRLEVSALLDLNSLITRLEIIESEG